MNSGEQTAKHFISLCRLFCSQINPKISEMGPPHIGGDETPGAKNGIPTHRFDVGPTEKKPNFVYAGRLLCEYTTPYCRL